MPVVSYLPTEILDYLDTHQPEESSAFGIGQRELSKALGYHPCSMSRPLSDLIQKGHLSVRRAPTRGGIRRQLVYQLTDAGRALLQRKEGEVPLLATSLPPPPNPFVGRRGELHEISRMGGQGGVILHVEGASGMGKSALVARAMRRLKAGRVPFWFTVRAASSARHFTLSLAHALSSIGSRQLAYYAHLPREPNGREVADLVHRALGDRAFLGVVDDLQVAPAEFRSFLVELLPALVRKDRSDMVTLISQEGPFLPTEGPEFRRIKLEGIDRSAAHELTDRRGGLGERFEAVFQATRGSPLLLQLAVAVPEAEINAAALPAAVVGRLSDIDVLGLLPAAVANEPVPQGLLAEIGGLGNSRLNELVGQGLLQRASEGRIEVLQAVRTALVARVPPAQVRAAHLELARFYGRSHRTEAVRERFLHLIAGEAWRLAGELLNRQEQPLLASGYSDALRSALRQLALSSPQEVLRVRALRAEAQLLRVHSEFAEGVSCLRRAAAESQKNPALRSECLLATVELHCRLQQIREAELVIADARRSAPATRRLQVLLLHAEARVLEARGDLPRAREMFSEAIQLARKGGQADLALEALARWSRLASITTEQEGMSEMIEAGIPEARDSGRMDIVFNLMSVRANSFMARGQTDLAKAEMNRVRAEAEALGYLSQLVYALSGLSALTTELQQWEEASLHARQAAELAERLGNDVILGHTLAIQCASEFRQGLVEEARQHGERAVSVLSRLPQSDSLPVAHAYLAEVYAGIPDLTQARLHYQAAIDLFEILGMTWWKEKVQSELGPRLTPVHAEVSGSGPDSPPVEGKPGH